VKNKLLLSILFSLLLTSAQASFLIEPYLGFSIAGDGDTQVAGANYDLSYSSPTIGARAGYQMLGFMAGIDYSMQTFDLESKSGNTTRKDGFKKNQLGVFVGYELPILLRAWATYYLSAGLDGDDAPATGQNFSSNDEFSGGSGYALGVGFTGLPFVSINLEYRQLSYDKFERSTNSLVGYGEDADLSEVMLSVSLPLNL